LKADEARVDKDADWLKRRIRYDVSIAAFGEENARAALAGGDVQLQRAVAELPKAKALADDVRKMRAAARTDLRRSVELMLKPLRARFGDPDRASILRG